MKEENLSEKEYTPTIDETFLPVFGALKYILRTTRARENLCLELYSGETRNYVIPLLAIIHSLELVVLEKLF